MRYLVRELVWHARQALVALGMLALMWAFAYMIGMMIRPPQ